MLTINKIPVLLLTGYLGSGKTTLLNRILTNNKGIRFAVIVNDIGEVNIDASLIQQGGVVSQKDDSLVALQNGCICCTLQTDLINQLHELAAQKAYDYIVIDCMPSLGMITINALTAADSVIIPVQAQFLPAKGMTQLMRSIDMVRNHTNDKLKIDGVLMTLVDYRTNLAKEVIDTIRTKYGMQIRICDAQIPVAVKAAEASKAGQSIFEYDKDSKPAKAYEALTKEVIRIGERERHRDEASISR